MKIKRLLQVITIVCTMQVQLAVFAQQPITGTIRDSSGVPLQGVTVTVKGTNITAVTNIQGAFNINASTGSTLVLSSVGFQQKEIVVTGSVINETLTVNDAAMDEVVVIGYQTVKKRDLTGAVGVVNTQNTQQLVQRSFPEALQGMSPGVLVRNGGAPGQEAVVNIRGLGTFTGKASPLYIIDGMFSDPNTTVNPNDIASVQVLKDASAAAIYGSRAANGVIIITTKKGREGPMKIGFSSRYTTSKIPKRYDMMNAQEYVETNTTAYQNAGYALQPAVANYNGDVNTNWADEMLQTGHVQDHNLTLSGGSKNSTYLISLSYFKDVGTLIQRDFERTALRINTESSRGRFKLGINSMISNSLRNAPYEENSPFLNNFEVGNPWYDVWNNLPIIPVKDDDLISTANPGGWGMGSSDARTFSRNPVAIANITSNRNNFFKLLGNAYVDFRFTDWLNYRFNAGGETSFDKMKYIRRDGPWYWNQSPKPSEVGENRSQYLSFLFEHTLNFNKRFNDHSINGVVGYTEQTTRNDNANASRTNLNIYGGNYFTTISSAGGAGVAAGVNSEFFIQSFLGRLNYNYKEKYFATFTFRSDKDSRFSEAHRTGFFPSGALAWTITNEDFFSLNWVNTLKLRASYGVLGIANLDPYQFTPFINQAPRAVFGSGQQEFPGATQARLVYENLRWEEKTTLNIGADASLFNNKLLITLDLFRSESNDVLVAQPVPQYLGNLQGDPLVNIGSIENKGIELELGYRPRAVGDFRWDIFANISVIRNKILELGNLGIDQATGLPNNYIQSGNTRSQVGRSIGEFFLLKTDGIFQSQREIDDHRAQARFAKPGDIRYVNIVDDNTDDDINDRDRQFIGSPWPKLTTGLQFNSSFKNFNLSIQFYGAFGYQLYNGVLSDLDGMGYSNYRRGINYWSEGNPDTDFPRLGVSYSTGVPGDPGVDQGIVSNVRGNSDRWLEDAGYLRLRIIELGYALPARWIGKIGLTNARISIGAQNLFTITNYSGLDPDIIGANVNLEPGVDNGNYPASRMVIFGLNLGL